MKEFNWACIIVTVGVASCLAGPLHAAVIHVPGDQPTIQAAIGVAVNGDEILVALDTYHEALDLLGKRIHLRSAEGPQVTILDGAGLGFSIVTCTSGETLATVIDGFSLINGEGTDAGNCIGAGPNGGALRVVGSSLTVTGCIFTDNGGLALVVGGAAYVQGGHLLVSGCTFSGNVAGWGGAIMHCIGGHLEVHDSLFQGNGAAGVQGGAIYAEHLTMSGCTFTNNVAAHGGGMKVRGVVTVTDCTFEGNVASHGGGIKAPANTGDSILIQNCTMTGNHGDHGGGVSLNATMGASITVDHCVMLANDASMGGGVNADLTQGGEIRLRNLTLTANHASFGAGAFLGIAEDGLIDMADCLVLGNDASGGGGGPVGGGGVFASRSTGGTIAIANCTILDNTADRTGGGIGAVTFIGFPGEMRIANCIIRGNAPDEIGAGFDPPLVTYNNVAGGYPGPGNIDGDPLFVNPAGGDFRLSAGSPCIDAGDNAAVPADVTIDLLGGLRFVDDPDTPDTGAGTPPLVDIGATEYQLAECPADVNGDGTVDVLDLLAVLAAWGSTGVPEDINGDGIVNVLDLLELLANWGPCP